MDAGSFWGDFCLFSTESELSWARERAGPFARHHNDHLKMMIILFLEALSDQNKEGTWGVRLTDSYTQTTRHSNNFNNTCRAWKFDQIINTFARLHSFNIQVWKIQMEFSTVNKFGLVCLVKCSRSYISLQLGSDTETDRRKTIWAFGHSTKMAWNYFT